MYQILKKFLSASIIIANILFISVKQGKTQNSSFHMSSVAMEEHKNGKATKDVQTWNAQGGNFDKYQCEIERGNSESII